MLLPNETRNLGRVLDLLRIPGPSGDEARVADYVVNCLMNFGVPSNAIVRDGAHKAFGGSAGNIIVDLPGTKSGPRRMLSAHLDTVPLCVGCEPVIDGRHIRSANPATGLGADDRAGIGVLLNTCESLMQHSTPHPPLTLLFSVAEEIGMQGVRNLSLDDLRAPEFGFNFDGGRARKITVGASGKDKITVYVTGISSHAGVNPGDGVSAMTIAGLAISELHHAGLLGECCLFGASAACNLGTIQGGSATNVVPETIVIEGEIRSKSLAVRDAMYATVESAFGRALTQVAGPRVCECRTSVTRKLAYEAYSLPTNAEPIRRAKEAVSALGVAPILEETTGGIDANWLVKLGIPTASLGCGHVSFHTVQEQLDISEYARACDIALLLATSE